MDSLEEFRRRTVIPLDESGPSLGAWGGCKVGHPGIQGLLQFLAFFFRPVGDQHDGVDMNSMRFVGRADGRAENAFELINLGHLFCLQQCREKLQGDAIEKWKSGSDHLEGVDPGQKPP